jgi:hypothetical protein
MTKIVALAAALSLSTLATVAQASEPLTMKPLHGISFDVGSDRAASYFVSDKGKCKLVLTLADPNGEFATFSATRFEAAIEAGKTTRYVSHGKTFEFGCAPDAQAMDVMQVSQLAAN